MMMIIAATTTTTTRMINMNFDWKKYQILLSIIHKLFNGPFMKAFELHQPINRITRKQLLRYHHSDDRCDVNENKSLTNVIFIIVLIFMITRTIIALSIDDTSDWSTRTFSVFHLINVKRQPPEIICLHFLIEHSIYFIWFYIERKNRTFFRLLMSYSRQVYDPELIDEDNVNRINSLMINRSSLFMGIDVRSIKYLWMMIKLMYVVHNTFIMIAPIMNILLLSITFFLINPIDNKLNELFHESYLLYYLNLVIYAIIFYYWNLIGSIYAANLYSHAIIIVLILSFKLHTLRKRLLYLKQRNRYCFRFKSSILLKFFNQHLWQQSQLCAEINFINRYIRHYLTGLFLVYTSLFCHALFVMLHSTTISTRLLFLGVCIYPAIIVMVLCSIIARLFQKMFDCHKSYQSILIYDYRNNMINNKLKLKILSTCRIIESGTIGLSFIDNTFIQYTTITTIIFETASLYFQLINAFSN